MTSLLFVQLPPPRFSFQDSPSNIPLAAGFLASALVQSQKFIETEILSPEIVDILADQGIVETIVAKNPSIIGMTLYVWNVERSLFIASNVKRRLPETIVMIGGPEVTPDNKWVLEHPAVDGGIFGEGEGRIATFVSALVDARSVEHVPGSFYRKDRKIYLNESFPPQCDLQLLVYPYLNNMITPSRDGTIFLETRRGCPFKCRYCYYHKAFKKLRFYPSSSIRQMLDWAYSQESPVKEIYLMDPTFNTGRGFRGLLKLMAGYRIQKDIALHTELRADLLTPGDVSLLREAGLKSAEIGLQSTNPEALRLASRKADLEKIAAGVKMLKEAGIEVITGIILGLPGDTPQGFRNTLSWLKKKEAYSVIHPFMLSILPGTDFRHKASELKLKYDERPPYLVRSTKTFEENEFRPALLECEQMFDMELDYIPPPSLVDKGSGLLTSAKKSDYISKWIVDCSYPKWRQVLSEVIIKATNPFTFWFKGACVETSMLEILESFAEANPHTIIHVILELDKLPNISFFSKALEATANPQLFINRSYRPIYREDEVVSINFTIILQESRTPRDRQRLAKSFYDTAFIVWETSEMNEEKLLRTNLPVLISWPADADRKSCEILLRLLAEVYRDHIEEVLFRDQVWADKWQAQTNPSRLRGKIQEVILKT